MRKITRTAITFAAEAIAHHDSHDGAIAMATKRIELYSGSGFEQKDELVKGLLASWRGALALLQRCKED